MRNENGKLNLDRARELTPPVNPVEAMRRQMALAVFDAVKENDVVALVEKIREQAMNGDHKAQKMFLELVGAMGGKQAAAQVASDGAGLKLMAQALQDLIDEIRIGKAKAQRDYAALPGPEEEE